MLESIVRADSLLILVGLCSAGCANSANTLAPHTPTGIASASMPELFPLKDNTVLEFDTSVEGTKEKGRLVMQIRRPRGNRVELDVAGKIRRLEATPQGVAIAGGGWLLKQPLTVGATYRGLSGQVTVIGVERVVDVPAGHFENCTETEESTSTAITRTTFCPGVGIAKLVIEGKLDGELRREVAELRFSGPRIDIGPEKTTAAPVGQ